VGLLYLCWVDVGFAWRSGGCVFCGVNRREPQAREGAPRESACPGKHSHRDRRSAIMDARFAQARGLMVKFRAGAFPVGIGAFLSVT
jgi:hypothetical protein